MKCFLIATVIFVTFIIRGAGGDVECTASNHEVGGCVKAPTSEGIHYTPLRGNVGGFQWVKVR